MEITKDTKCQYDNKTQATRLCSACGSPLCNSCGFEYNNETLCNKCYDNIDEQETGICKSCGSELEPIMENNGFTEPEGPSKWEVSGYKLCDCHRDNEEEDN